MSSNSRNVFVNCPFDADFRSCFEALLFAVYKVRCALEDDDAANIRFDKLRRLIRESPRTIHDLSRTELGANDLPRFNMPFELGLAMGAKHFGNPRQRRNTALIMVRQRYTLPAYLSDLSGSDPTAHHGDPSNVIRAVTRYLHTTPSGQLLPGPQHYIAGFAKFKENLPAMATALRRTPDEIDPYADYRVYLAFLAEFHKAAKRVNVSHPSR